MKPLRIAIVFLLAGTVAAFAQLDGPGSSGAMAALNRLLGTNTAFTAQLEVQALSKDNKELIGTPMNFMQLDNRVRVEVDVTRMRGPEQPNAVAQLKPLGMDQVVSISRPDLRVKYIAYPKLRAFLKLPMTPAEAEAALKPAKLERTTIGNEKMDGHPCLKQRVVVTDGKEQDEATAWIATDLRDFPVCVATREGKDTMVMRFRQVQFVRPDAAKFEPPAGYTECADQQALLAGPVVKYMKENNTALKPATKPSSNPSKPAPKKK